MKKAIIVVCGAVLVLAAVVFYNALTAKVSIEEILPQGAAMYMRMSDVKKQVDELKATRLWKNIEGIDVAMLMERSGASNSAIEGYKDIRAKVSNSLADAVIDKYFGREMAIALYPIEIKEDSAIKPADLLSGIILVTRPKRGANFVEFVSKMLNKAAKKLEVSEKTYKGGKVTFVKLNGGSEIAYTKIKGLWVIGLGRNAAYSCLDVAAKTTPSLSRDKSYVTTMLNFPKGAKTVAYGNIELLIKQLNGVAASVVKSSNGIPKNRAESFTQSVDEAFDLYAGFKTFGYADLSVKGKIGTDKTILCYDKSELDPLCAKFYSMPARKTGALKLAPSNTLYYAWGCFDARAYWEYLKGRLEKECRGANGDFSIKDVLADVEKNMGVSVDKDIIPALGDELGVFVEDIDLGGFLPVPQYVFFIKMKDKAAIERSVDLLLKSFGLVLETEARGGSDIKYVNLPLGQNLQPSYCYINDYLLISVGRKPLQDSIDSFNGTAKSLLNNDSFKAVNLGLTDKNNNVYFVNSDLLLQRVKDICDWGLGFASIMSEQYNRNQHEAQESLAKLKGEVAQQEAELQKLTAGLDPLKREIENLVLQGADTSLKEKELGDLEEDIGSKKDILSLNKEEIERLEAVTLHKVPMAEIDYSLVKLYFDEALYPILDGMRSVKAIGSRTTYGEKMSQTEAFYKIER